MIRLATAVIKYEDKVLLMRRALNQKHPGFWEFPNTEVESDERVSAALYRELDEELFIKAEIGKLITTFKDGEYEIYAYNVKYHDGLIRLPVHDNMEWVPLNMAMSYNLLPVDKKIVMHLTKTKETKAKPESLISVLDKIISKPVLNKNTNKYVVEIKNGFFGTSHKFNTQNEAINFYVNTVRNIMKRLQDQQQIPQR